NPEQGYSQDFNFSQYIHNFQQQYFCCDQCGGPHETFQYQQVNFFEPCCEYYGDPRENFQCQPVNYCKPKPSYGSYYPGCDQFGDFHPQQYFCCENCGGPHDTFQCQPTNEDYCYEQNSCYNSNSFGYDHCQPPQYTVDHPIFDAHNDFLKSRNEFSISQNKLSEQMTQLTSMCEMFCQIVQKKQEEKRIEEEQAAKARYWKILACCDDDDDYDSAITPILSTEEPIDSLSMGDERLDSILTTESDEVIKSSVENLVLIPSEFEEFSSTDDDSFSFDNIHYIEASPPDGELVNSEVMEIVIQEVGGIEASNDNPIPFYDPIISRTPPNLTPSGDSDFFLEIEPNQGELTSVVMEDNLAEPRTHVPNVLTTHPTLMLDSDFIPSDNSLPESGIYYFDIEEKNSGSTTIHTNISLSDLECFNFKREPIRVYLIGVELSSLSKTLK
nr:hypothetical protein [Tanacetum cinerariifolium]